MRHIVYIVHAEILTPGFTGLRMTIEVVNVILSVAIVKHSLGEGISAGYLTTDKHG